MNAIHRAALAAVLLSSLACSRAPQQDLKSVKVPAGFTFQTSRSVSVQIAGSAALVPAGSAGRLTLARPDGKVLFDGRLSSKAETAVKLPLPTKDQTLVATLVLGNGQTLRQEIPVVGDAATHTFQ